MFVFKLYIFNVYHCLKFKVVNTLCFTVLDKRVKSIRGVRLDNRKVLCAPGPTTKYFERFFVVEKTM